MSGILTNSPADVLRSAMIALGLGVAPDSTPWPVYVSSEPALPDNVITLVDSQGLDGGFSMPDRERQEFHGVQIRVRATDHPTGWTKINAIAIALDHDLSYESVTIDGHDYCVYSVSRASGPMNLGKDVPTNKLSIFTLNVLVHLRES